MTTADGFGRQFGNCSNRLHGCLTTWILINIDNFFNNDDTMTSLLKQLSISIPKIGVIKRYELMPLLTLQHVFGWLLKLLVFTLQRLLGCIKHTVGCIGALDSWYFLTRFKCSVPRFPVLHFQHTACSCRNCQSVTWTSYSTTSVHALCDACLHACRACATTYIMIMVVKNEVMTTGVCRARRLLCRFVGLMNRRGSLHFAVG